MSQEDDEAFAEAVRRRREEQNPPQPPRVVMGTGGDPALRMALINAGIITPDQLMIEEEKLRAAREGGGVIVSSPVEDRPRTTDRADPIAGSRSAQRKAGVGASSRVGSRRGSGGDLRTPGQ